MLFECRCELIHGMKHYLVTLLLINGVINGVSVKTRIYFSQILRLYTYSDYFDLVFTLTPIIANLKGTRTLREEVRHRAS